VDYRITYGDEKTGHEDAGRQDYLSNFFGRDNANEMIAEDLKIESQTYAEAENVWVCGNSTVVFRMA